ncbi:hypothetical protein RRG08_043794 [Elysia crispata]|uniref:Uncharacterized protein n=1 Tax=Elysia crispata TaxID=231223 RepID=A0AAE0Z612_9GAST|nr:hypothetical protein RRG08_043794 [Elysia crispata]
MFCLRLFYDVSYSKKYHPGDSKIVAEHGHSVRTRTGARMRHAVLLSRLSRSYSTAVANVHCKYGVIGRNFNAEPPDRGADLANSSLVSSSVPTTLWSELQRELDKLKGQIWLTRAWSHRQSRPPCGVNYREN